MLGQVKFEHTTKRQLSIPISSSTAQHFVDADDMERVNSHSDVESILTTVLHQVLREKT